MATPHICSSRVNAAALNRLTRKAAQSRCRFRVSAMGLNRRGDVVGVVSNYPRFVRPGGSVHAEIALMQMCRGLHTIIICRIGVGGALLPIDPCENCLKQARRLGIRIVSVKPGE